LIDNAIDVVLLLKRLVRMIKKIGQNIYNLGSGSKVSLLKIKAILSEETTNTQDVIETYAKLISGKSSKDEISQANLKLKELLKVVGLGGFCILPGTIITLPILIAAAGKVGVELLPESVYKQYPNLRSQKNIVINSAEDSN